MKKILIIAKKEFLDMFRDKRTLMRMILIPLIAFPIIINLITSIQSSQREKEAKKELTIGYFLNGQSKDMVNSMDTTAHFEFLSYPDSATLRADIIANKLNMGIWFDSDFDQKYASGEQGEYGVFFRGADHEEYDRFEELLDDQTEFLVQERLASNELPADYMEPVILHRTDLSSIK
jgi:sodium transport system permease protein